MGDLIQIQRPVTWTPARVGELCHRYRDGETFAAIASAIGCTKNAAIGKFNRLIDEGDRAALEAADARAGSKTADLIAEWMADNGGSIADCARALGMSHTTVRGSWQRIRTRLGAQAA